MTKPKRFCLVDGCVADAVDGGVCHGHGADPALSPRCVVGSPPGTSILLLDNNDLDDVARLVDHDACIIAQLLWNHIGAASFAGLEPFTLEPRR